MGDIVIRDRRAGRGGLPSTELRTGFATSGDPGTEKRWEHLARLAECTDRCWRLGYHGKESCSACFSPILVELAIPP
jgi:hypothetical protein